MTVDGRDGEDDDAIALAVPATALANASNVLVTGPSREAVRGVPTTLLDTIADDADGAVAVTTSESPRTVLDRIDREVAGIDRDRVGVVDCTPKDAVVRSNTDALHWSMPSPMDMTGSSMAVHECLETLFERGVSTRHLHYDTLSRLLMSGEREAVARYAHQLLVLTHAPGALGVYPVYTNMTDDDDLATLTHLFDGVVEVRRKSGERQLRCRGLTDASSEWVAIGPPAPGRIGDVDVH